MIEDVICRNSVSKKDDELQKRVDLLEERLRSLEKSTAIPAPTVCQKEGDVWIDALKDLEIILPQERPSPVVVVTKKEVVVEEVVEEVEEEDEEEVEEEVEEAEEEVEEEEVEEEAEEVEEEAEEEAEEEGVEEIIYKGKTYYKDSDNNIYNATGDELGDPIGVWDVSRERVLFKRQL
jgi:predicted nucleotide-binding protein (sugar kinase/HSP70/actin superfamily)